MSKLDEEATSEGVKEYEKFYHQKAKRILVWVVVAIGIILALVIIFRIRDWKAERKEKAEQKQTSVWYLSYSEPPEQRRGTKALDEGFMVCEDIINNASKFSMTCYNRRFNKIDVFHHDKNVDKWGTWRRKGDDSVGGNFYLDLDPNGVFRGEVVAKDGVTRAPILLYRTCGTCSEEE